MRGAVLAATDHPRPLLRRPVEMLDGTWAFALGDAAAHTGPAGIAFDREIRVPFAPESPASGIGESSVERCWYRRPIRLTNGASQRSLLHFGAIDRHATVYANGAPVAEHAGGYTGFTVDLTDHAADGHVDLVVRADDDPTDLHVPRGKQDWQAEPHAIWYPRTTGIWRSVWLESVPETRIEAVDLQGRAATTTVEATVHVTGPRTESLRVAITLTGPGGRVLVDDVCRLTGRSLERQYAVGDGGIDDRTSLVWWPRRPTLLDVDVRLLDTRGEVVDHVRSYTALRDVEVSDGLFLLNGRPYPLRLVLDQGYWPDTGLTPPSSAALQRDVELTRALGFNGARKHQKVEDPRYLAWADRLGLMVWVEMPSAYVHSRRSATAVVHEWTEIVRASAGHPSVVAYVPVNESWGVPHLEGRRDQRSLVTALASIASALGCDRPVSANDGWETIGGDIVGIHDYDQDAGRLGTKYGTRAAIDQLLAGRRGDGRYADLERSPAGERAVVLSEFGGIALRGADDIDRAWGYREVTTADELLANYAGLWRAVHASEALAGACWTQLTDTYQEINGLLRMDRTPKVDVQKISAATRGRTA